jgi:hypothetical protein
MLRGYEMSRCPRPERRRSLLRGRVLGLASINEDAAWFGRPGSSGVVIEVGFAPLRASLPRALVLLDCWKCPSMRLRIPEHNGALQGGRPLEMWFSRNGIKSSRNSLVEKALPQNASVRNHVRIFLRWPRLAAWLRPARAMRVDDQLGQRRAGQ